MKNILQWLLPSAFGQLFCLKFSDSQSSSTTENKTEVRDMRVVGGDGSSNLSTNDSTLSYTSNATSNTNISSTDHGAIGAGVSLANAGIGLGWGGLSTADKTFALSTDLVGENTKQTISAGLSMFKDALGFAEKTNTSALSAVSSARGDVATAWQDSQTPENSMLKIAGFVVVGLVAVALVAGKMK